VCGCPRTDDLEPTAAVMCRERSRASLHHKPLVEGTDNKRKSQGMALFITLCGEVYLVIRDESCSAFFLLFSGMAICWRRYRKIDENSRVVKIM
jgi:hypothetical protein